MLTANTLADSKTVLLVDDDPSTVNLYGKRLEQAGFRTTSAFESGQELPDLSVDLIILNLMAPKRGGLEALQAIRSGHRYKNTPVLLLSNPYLPDLAQKGLKAGGNKALPKSECTSSELVSVSRQLVGIGESSRNRTEESAGAELAERLKQELREGGSAEIAATRQLCLRYVEVNGSPEGNEVLDKVYQGIRFLSTRAGLAGCGKIAQLAGAIEAMLFDQLLKSGGAMAASTTQTLIQGVQCLEHLFTSGEAWSCESTTKARVLVVDDDQVSNRANEVALKRAQYDTLSATNGLAALIQLNKNPFELILLDINMPGMNGIELCQKLRSIPHHKGTPVIFVTSSADFQTRAKGLLSGGDDLIAKPISPVELIVKATIFLLDKTKSQKPKEPPRTEVQPPLAQPNAVGPNAGAQARSALVEHTQIEDQARRQSVLPTSVGEKLLYLTQALADETKRREDVEEQATANAKRRRELEAAIEENQRSQALFEHLLEESQRQVQEAGREGGQVNLTGRRQALLEVSNFVADKLFRLKQALAEETRRTLVLEQEITDNAKRRTELESALGEIQRVQEAFQAELDRAANPQQLLELESSLAESQNARQRLQGELEATRRELETLRSGQAAKQSNLEARTRELQASQAAVEEKVLTLTQALEAEGTRRESAELLAGQSATRRNELEAELAEMKRTQAYLQKELEDAHNQRQALEESVVVDKSRLHSRTQELEAAQAQADRETKRLKEALVAENERRDAIIRQAEEHTRCRGEIEAALAQNVQTGRALQREMEASASAKRRAELEAELVESRQGQSQLRGELEELQKQLKVLEEKSISAEALAVRTRELQATQAQMEQQVKSLSASLTEEIQRREGAELEAESIGQRRGALEAELRSLQQQLEEVRNQQLAQQEGSRAERSRLEAHAQELQVAKGEVEAQVHRLTTALTDETRRREGAEQQAGEIGRSRSDLEGKLVQLRQELEQSQTQLQAQQESSLAEQSRLEARTRELQAVQTEVEHEVKRMTDDLSHETRRREEAQQRADKVGQERGQLELELGRLRQLLEETRHQHHAQQESARVEQSSLQIQMRELQATRTAVEQRIKFLEEALTAETKRREAAEERATQLARRLSDLEAELAENQTLRADLRQELDSTQKLLQGHQELSGAEQTRLAARITELQAAHSDTQQQFQRLTESLAEETNRREGVERQVDTIGRHRSELEAELAENKESKAHLLLELEAAQKQLSAQQQVAGAEQSELEARTQRLHAAQSEVEQQVKRLTAALAEETTHRENAEQQVGQITHQRAESEVRLNHLTQQLEEAQKQLEAEVQLRQQLQQAQQQLMRMLQLAESQQADAQLRQQLEEAQRQLRVQEETYQAQNCKLEAQMQQLQAAQREVEERFQRLTEALAEETRRREGAEQHAGEVSKRRSELEAELAENKRAQERLRQQLEEVQKQVQALKSNYVAEQGKLQTRTQELQAAQVPVEEKIKSLTEALVWETKRREAVEKLAVDAFKQRRELEAQLLNRQQSEQALRQELEISARGKARAQLEAELAQNQQAQAKLRQELEQAQKQMQAQVPSAGEQPNRLQVGQGEVLQGVKRLTETLAQETKCRKEAQQQACELSERRRELETQLVALRQQLEASQTQLHSQKESAQVQQTQLVTRIDELGSARAEVEQQVKRLTDTLAQEITRRKETEQRVGQIGKERKDLETELAQTRQAQEKLRQELAEAQKRLQEQKERAAAEQSRLEARTQQLQAAQAEVEQQVKQLTETLADENRQREGAERQAGEIEQQRGRLETQLALLQQELDQAQTQLRLQQQKSGIEHSMLESRTQELQGLHADLTQRIKRLTETLGEEIQRRKAAEQEAGELGRRRSELETQLGTLRYELFTSQQQLQSQAQSSGEERTRLEARIEELQSARANTEQEVERLTAALAGETRLREGAEHRASEVAQQRSELEGRLTQLRLQLESAQKELQALSESSGLREAKLQTRIEELEAARGEVEGQVGGLTEALAGETTRRANAERHADEIEQRRGELASQLTGMRQELEDSQKQLQSQRESLGNEQTRLQAHIDELQASQVALDSQVKQLSQTLAEETCRRQGVEQQAAEIARLRSELETRLAENNQAQARLEQELRTAQQQLEAQQSSSGAEQAKLQGRIEELLAAQAEMEQQAKRLTESLSQQTKGREQAERQADEIGRDRTNLEAELAANRQAQENLRHELRELEQNLLAHQKSSYAVQLRLETHTRELRTARAEIVEQANRLTTALSEQTRRREDAEQHAREVDLRRSELETQLVEARQVQARFQQELDQQSLHCRQLTEKMAQAEGANAELVAQAHSARELINARENSIQSLGSQIRERQAELDRVASLLQSEIAAHRRRQSQAEALERQTVELNHQLLEKVAEQQRWHQRESELQHCISQQTEQLLTSAATARSQEGELSKLKSEADDLRVIQSALCAKVRELTTQQEDSSVRIRELGDQASAATQTIQARARDLAALRHAVLEVVRVGSKVNSERLQIECQAVNGWKRLMGTLLHTPLSLAQRGLIAEIVAALDGWQKARADAANGFGFQVECPDFSPSEFNCAEIIESALSAVRKHADETGTNIRTALVGPVPALEYGNPQHIHQLITMLASSLSDLAHPENLDLQLSFERKPDGADAMVLSLLLAPTCSADSLCLRLRSFLESSAQLGPVRRDDAELTLSSAWQLTLALGGSSTIETTSDGKLLLQVSLPFRATGSPLSENRTGSF